ncbi:hypothetical protein AB0C02_21660 [Micromonospora sp. NPDC048999]|uniref:hypothetical protein n=1 Tax=Micromonospora sp. NPDC048999 TaxID=3155391 RepID=UPI0033DE4EB1
MRRPESAEQSIGQVIQEREQSEARRRLLDQAQRLREAQWRGEPTQSNVPMTPDERTGDGPRGHR